MPSNRSLQAGPRWIISVFVATCIPLLRIFISHGNLSSFKKNVLEDLSFAAPLIKERQAGGLSATLIQHERKIGPKTTIMTSPKPILVVCNNINPELIPMFSDFTLVRLKQNEKPPGWNATVFLEPSGCEDHEYVKEATRLREESLFLSAPGISAAENGTWLHGVHWPNFSSNRTKYLRMVKNRPIIMRLWGEVFWRTLYEKEGCRADIVVFRAVERTGKDCLTMHYLQGVSTAIDAKDSLEQVHVSTVKRDKFCSFIVKYNSSEPTKMFESPLYDIDAIVRHMFFLQLGEYKPCERILDCPGGPYTNYQCMEGYKFHITMENSLVDGYVSEKVFNGKRGGGIPLYFGASDISKYINPRAIVHCNVSREVLEVMRSFYPRGQRPRPFLFKNNTRPTDKELIVWADKYLRKELTPCVERVIALDKNDAMYDDMLKEKFIVNPDIMSGVYPMRGVALAHSVLTNPPSWVDQHHP